MSNATKYPRYDADPTGAKHLQAKLRKDWRRAWLANQQLLITQARIRLEELEAELVAGPPWEGPEPDLTKPM